jgi:hypothetical protein
VTRFGWFGVPVEDDTESTLQVLLTAEKNDGWRGSKFLSLVGNLKVLSTALLPDMVQSLERKI